MDQTRTHLAEEMEGRRRQLRVKWTEVAKRAGMSPQNLLRIRNGEISVTDDAADGIDEALYWKHGSVQAILNGGSATPIDIPISPRRRKRSSLDPLTSSPEEIMEFLEEVRQVQGDEVYRELFEGTVEVRRLAVERLRKSKTSDDSGVLPTSGPNE